MDNREEVIAHMPTEAQELMRFLFGILDATDVDLGLKPQKGASGTAIDEGYKRRPPRNLRELELRLRERAVAIEPIMLQINRWMATYPAPMFIHPDHHLDGPA